MENYLINQNTVLLTGEYDQLGKLCTRVIEGKESFLVKMKPMDIINNTLLGLGSDFRGCRESSKKILGSTHMCPIKINCRQGIWLFPTKSFNDDYCVWFSLNHVKRTKAKGVRKTKVYLSFGHTFTLDMKESSFNNKRQKAEDLRVEMLKNSRGPLTFYIEERKQGLSIREDEGRNPYRIK